MRTWFRKAAFRVSLILPSATKLRQLPHTPPTSVHVAATPHQSLHLCWDCANLATCNSKYNYHHYAPGNGLTPWNTPSNLKIINFHREKWPLLHPPWGLLQPWKKRIQIYQKQKYLLEILVLELASVPALRGPMNLDNMDSISQYTLCSLLLLLPKR